MWVKIKILVDYSFYIHPFNKFLFQYLYHPNYIRYIQLKNDIIFIFN
jgi:hypothetical protein